MDLSVFFTLPESDQDQPFIAWKLGASVQGFRQFPRWQEADVVIMGLPAPGNEASLPSAVRSSLYNLSGLDRNLRLADLGDMKPKEEPELYEDAISYVLEQLMQAGKTVLILADRPGYTFAQYKSYESLEAQISYVYVGATLALEAPHALNPDTSFNQRILLHEPNILFGYTHLGYQRYLINPEALSSLQDLHCAAVRYGEIQAAPEEMEPFLRGANLVSLDLAAMRIAEMPAAREAGVAGFSVQEICQLCRYAGHGEQLSSLLVSGFDAGVDSGGVSAQSAALAIWYFLDGRSQRRPDGDESTWRRYTVTLNGPPHQVDFLESTRSGRWWMEVPYPEALDKPGTGPVKRIPCSRKDYEAAQRDELPRRWWLTHNRLP